MAMNISGFGAGNNYPYKSIDTNSKQYKAAADEYLDAVIAEEAMMTPEQKMMYVLLGGREAHMRNVMGNFNSDGDFIGPSGVVVPGMYHGRDGAVDRSTWQQLIDVSDDARQKMFDNVKREFIQENGISNGDTTKRSKIFREYQLSVKKEDRAKGTWTLQQYEGKYRSAMYAAVKAANPKWEPGQPFDPGILDSVTRESVESTLVKSGNTLVKKTSSGSTLDMKI
ncbi:hypothetical protein D7X88_18170 [bacterium C-53]|nr:hypothetical protein [Lachnospiraceae bacterium]NBI04865.1 hypothetical protein [Lachnospiraceae bacterium]RKJ07678.1 hypothetical protein D7X88_18170 [bacterium C-53]